MLTDELKDSKEQEEKTTLHFSVFVLCFLFLSLNQKTKEKGQSLFLRFDKGATLSTKKKKKKKKKKKNNQKKKDKKIFPQQNKKKKKKKKKTQQRKEKRSFHALYVSFSNEKSTPLHKRHFVVFLHCPRQ
jgi:hypothetical protein